ncbi:hypothetical protein SEUCBS139899_006761 [Sporothrix eucalyptigena]|uniref:Lea domain containing protein n=1 Tax=Sporothrix eucalyptigena TaxID=1812306 RepID=A0ABP0CKD9_9PEZI
MTSPRQFQPPLPSESITPSPIIDEADSSSEDEYDDPPEEEIVEHEHTPVASPRPSSSSSPLPAGEPRVQTHFHDRGKAPAYVAPIPKIPKVGKVSPVNGISTKGRPSFPSDLLAKFTGKVVDEYGDVHEDGPDSPILGRVAGDLPSMVGRSVSNDEGDVVDDDGSLLGYVDQIEGHTPSQTLEEYTGGGASGFRVDGDGNILDAAGNVVGRMNKPEGKGESSQEKKPPQKGDGQPPPVNAESFRQESPSDIFLDVKSTTEGIQLTIRIPTVFPTNGQPPRVPKVSFS